MHVIDTESETTAIGISRRVWNRKVRVASEVVFVSDVSNRQIAEGLIWAGSGPLQLYCAIPRWLNVDLTHTAPRHHHVMVPFSIRLSIALFTPTLEQLAKFGPATLSAQNAGARLHFAGRLKREHVACGRLRAN